MKHVFYIHPAWSDQAGQCRIYYREVWPDQKYDGAHVDYKLNTDKWYEAGLMNSRGKLVYLNAPRDVIEDVRSSEPLMAGTEFHYTPEEFK